MEREFPMLLMHLANSGLGLLLLAGTPLPNAFNIPVLIEIHLSLLNLWLSFVPSVGIK